MPEPTKTPRAAGAPVDPSDDVPGVKTGFRDEPTVPAETRTVKLGGQAPWLAGPEPPPPEAMRPRDPMLVPVVVFVGILVVMIGYVLLSQPSPGRAQHSSASSF
jgi:hypothetical protein